MNTELQIAMSLFMQSQKSRHGQKKREREREKKKEGKKKKEKREKGTEIYRKVTTMWDGQTTAI